MLHDFEFTNLFTIARLEWDTITVSVDKREYILEMAPGREIFSS